MYFCIVAYGGDISGTSGQIASPNYPRQYPHNTDYAWTITVPMDMRVRITFVTMDMEALDCRFDYVRVSCKLICPPLLAQLWILVMVAIHDSVFLSYFMSGL